MADRLDQRLEPGERVLYRLSEAGKTRDWRRMLIATALVLAAILIANVLAYFLPDDRLAIGLTTSLGIFGAFFLVEDNTTDAAVTDRRLLVVTGWNPTTTTEVKPEETESIELLRGGLRVRRREGPPVLLVRRRGPAELAAALAGIAKLQPPPLPRPRDLAADRVMLASILATGFAAALACMALFANLAWTQESDWHARLALFAPVLAVFPGGLLGVLIGLILVGRDFTRAEMRAWIEGSAGFARAMGAGGLSARLAGRGRALADRLYGPPAGPGTRGAERHGR